MGARVTAGTFTPSVVLRVARRLGWLDAADLEGDVESLGAEVTSAVVQSIFLIILVDALFAIIYMELHI